MLILVVQHLVRCITYMDRSGGPSSGVCTNNGSPPQSLPHLRRDRGDVLASLLFLLSINRT